MAISDLGRWTVSASCDAVRSITLSADCSADVLRRLYAELKVKLLSAIWCFTAIPWFAPDSSPVDLSARHLTDFPSLGVATFRIPLARSAARVFVAYNFGLHHFARSDSTPLLHLAVLVGLLVHLLPRITESSFRMEATWLTVEKKVERCDWLVPAPVTRTGCTGGVSPTHRRK